MKLPPGINLGITVPPITPVGSQSPSQEGSYAGSNEAVTPDRKHTFPLRFLGDGLDTIEHVLEKGKGVRIKVIDTRPYEGIG